VLSRCCGDVSSGTTRYILNLIRSYIYIYIIERIAFAIVPVEVRYPDRIVGIALLL
jgi:hypothetical protein